MIESCLKTNYLLQIFVKEVFSSISSIDDVFELFAFLEHIL